jgi:hypothetical protein
MFWRRRSTSERYIDGGRVPCPKAQGDVELDACFGCRFVQEVRVGARPPYVRCEPPANRPVENF